MLRNKNPLIVTPENAGINGFARINTSFAILISDRGDFCKTYFCCQGAILVLSVTKNAWPELSFAKWSLIFHFTIRLTIHQNAVFSRFFALLKSLAPIFKQESTMDQLNKHA